jgi:hypothetical protein
MSKSDEKKTEPLDNLTKCKRMLLENPRGSSKLRSEWWVAKACEWNVYVMKGNWRELIPNFKRNNEKNFRNKFFSS